MKRLNYFSLGMLAVAATFSACSSSDEVTGDNPGVENAARAYINVNIVNNQGTRAVDDANFNDGTNESDVTSTRFYFFDASGKPYPIDGNNNCYKDYSSTDLTYENESSANITSQASLAIEIKPTGEYPKYLVAVLNPASDLTTSPTDLNALKVDQLSPTTAKANNYFVMSNSAYVDDGTPADVVDATVLNNDPGNSVFYKTADEAKESNANAVNVYVERVLAKVKTISNPEGSSKFTANTSDEDKSYLGTFKLTADAPVYVAADGTNEATSKTNEEITAKILGWNVTSTTKTSNLIKDIDKGWSDAGLKFGTDNNNPWNEATRHRSYWATTSTTSQSYGYNNQTKAAGNLLNEATAYCLENTGTFTGSDNNITYSNPNSTKVIVYAQLIDGNNNAMEMVKWNGLYYKVNDFKTLIFNAAKAAGIKYATAPAEGATASYNDLKADMIDLRYNYESLSKQHKEAYKGIPTIKETSKEQYVFQIGTATGKKLADVEEALTNYICNYYEQGYTYFYTDVKHLNDEAAIVRNHAYDVAITEITGLGTPIVIYDKDDPNKPENTPDPDGPKPGEGDTDPQQPEIIPERPNDTKAYIKAKINVLSWRIVKNENVTVK